MVYEDAEKYYEKIAQVGHQLMREALDALFDLPADTMGSQNQGEFFAFNSTMFPRSDVIKVPLSSTSSPHVQVAEDAKHGYVLMQSQHGSGYSIPREILPENRGASGTARSLMNA